MSAFDPYEAEPIRAILHRALLRYIDVTPAGLRLQGEPRPVREVSTRILAFGGARTLYRRRKPICRSLDGIIAITDPTRACTACEDRQACTNQVRVDLFIGVRAYRCLLAFTSAQNFLAYDATLRHERKLIEKIDTIIQVVDRGSWGELRFREATPAP